MGACYKHYTTIHAGTAPPLHQHRGGEEDKRRHWPGAAKGVVQLSATSGAD